MPKHKVVRRPRPTFGNPRLVQDSIYYPRAYQFDIPYSQLTLDEIAARNRYDMSNPKIIYDASKSGNLLGSIIPSFVGNSAKVVGRTLAGTVNDMIQSSKSSNRTNKKPYGGTLQKGYYSGLPDEVALFNQTARTYGVNDPRLYSSKENATLEELALIEQARQEQEAQAQQAQQFANEDEAEAAVALQRIEEANIVAEQIQNQQESALINTPAPKSTSETHTIKPGETLGAIAQAYGVNYQDIAEANNIDDPNKIVAGKTLTIPNVSKKNSSQKLDISKKVAKGSKSTTPTNKEIQQSNIPQNISTSIPSDKSSKSTNFTTVKPSVDTTKTSRTVIDSKPVIDTTPVIDTSQVVPSYVPTDTINQQVVSNPTSVVDNKPTRTVYNDAIDRLKDLYKPYGVSDEPIDAIAKNYNDYSKEQKLLTQGYAKLIHTFGKEETDNRIQAVFDKIQSRADTQNYFGTSDEYPLGRIMAAYSKMPDKYQIAYQQGKLSAKDMCILAEDDVWYLHNGRNDKSKQARAEQILLEEGYTEEQLKNPNIKRHAIAKAEVAKRRYRHQAEDEAIREMFELGLAPFALTGFTSIPRAVVSTAGILGAAGTDYAISKSTDYDSWGDFIEQKTGVPADIAAYFNPGGIVAGTAAGSTMASRSVARAPLQNAKTTLKQTNMAKNPDGSIKRIEYATVPRTQSTTGRGPTIGEARRAKKAFDNLGKDTDIPVGKDRQVVDETGKPILDYNGEPIVKPHKTTSKSTIKRAQEAYKNMEKESKSVKRKTKSETQKVEEPKVEPKVEETTTENKTTKTEYKPSTTEIESKTTTHKVQKSKSKSKSKSEPEQKTEEYTTSTETISSNEKSNTNENTISDIYDKRIELLKQKFKESTNNDEKQRLLNEIDRLQKVKDKEKVYYRAKNIKTVRKQRKKAEKEEKQIKRDINTIKTNLETSNETNVFKKLSNSYKNRKVRRAADRLAKKGIDVKQYTQENTPTPTSEPEPVPTTETTTTTETTPTVNTEQTPAPEPKPKRVRSSKSVNSTKSEPKTTTKAESKSKTTKSTKTTKKAEPKKETKSKGVTRGKKKGDPNQTSMNL